MAGNCLLKILAGFCWAMVIAGSVGTFFSFLPGVIIFLICALELVIGYLQAYVFTLLFLIYLNDVM
jgi:F-type H+-transporting ATPase subunit a